MSEGDLVIRRGSGLFRVSASGEALGAPRSLVDDPRLEGSFPIGGGDLDGDGHDDFLTRAASGKELLVWLTRGDGIELATTLQVTVNTVFQLADVDGGGQADLIYEGDPGIGIRWGEGSR